MKSGSRRSVYQRDIECLSSPIAALKGAAPTFDGLEFPAGEQAAGSRPPWNRRGVAGSVKQALNSLRAFVARERCNISTVLIAQRRPIRGAATGPLSVSGYRSAALEG